MGDIRPSEPSSHVGPPPSGQALARMLTWARQSTDARRAIRAYLDARGHPKGSEPLFVSREGHALSVRRAQAAVLEIGHKAKLERVTPQVLRHTFAVNYLKDNPGKLPQLATLLGHQSPDSVAIYAQSP